MSSHIHAPHGFWNEIAQLATEPPGVVAISWNCPTSKVTGRTNDTLDGEIANGAGRRRPGSTWQLVVPVHPLFRHTEYVRVAPLSQLPRTTMVSPSLTTFVDPPLSSISDITGGGV
jgi:hypothetical protein